MTNSRRLVAGAVLQLLAVALGADVLAAGLPTNGSLPFEVDGIRFAYEPNEVFSSSADWLHAREPLLTRVPSGELVCVLYTGGRQEPSPVNVVAEVRSSDDGKTWSKPRTIFSHPSRACWATELFAAGDRGPLLFFQTFAADRFYLELRPFVTHMTADGWSLPEGLTGVPPNFTVRQGQVLSDGSWLFPVYWQAATGGWRDVIEYGDGEPKYDNWDWTNYPFASAAIRSKDGGRTWRVSNAIMGRKGVPWEVWEPCMVELEQGHVHMYARGRDAFLWEADSYDYGMSFGEPYIGSIPNACTKATVLKRNGDVILINNVCTPDSVKRDQLEVWVSADNCKTWAHKRTIAKIGKSKLEQVCYPTVHYDEKSDTLYIVVDSKYKHYLLKIPGRDLSCRK